MMKQTVTALVLSACTFAPLALRAADKPAAAATTAPSTAKGEMVKVTLKNRSKMTQNLVIDGRNVSLGSEESYVLNAPAGTQVMGDDNTVKVQIAKSMNGATVSFK